MLSVKLTNRAVAGATSRGDLYCPEGRCGRKENAVSVFPTHIAALGQYDAGGTAPIPGTNIFLLSMKVVLGFCDILCFCFEILKNEIWILEYTLCLFKKSKTKLRFCKRYRRKTIS